MRAIGSELDRRHVDGDRLRCAAGRDPLPTQALLALLFDAGAFGTARRIVGLTLILDLGFERADDRRMRRRIRGGKAGQLVAILRGEDVDRSIVFTRTKRGADVHPLSAFTSRRKLPIAT